MKDTKLTDFEEGLAAQRHILTLELQSVQARLEYLKYKIAKIDEELKNR